MPSFKNYEDQFPNNPRVMFARAWAKWQTACQVVVWPSGMTQCQRITRVGDDIVFVQGGVLLVRR